MSPERCSDSGRGRTDTDGHRNRTDTDGHRNRTDTDGHRNRTDTDGHRGRVDRRTVLALLGSTSVGLGGLSGVASASEDGSRPNAENAGQQHQQQQTQYSVVQGEQCFAVDPLSGDQPAEELYDLRIPGRYEGDNGATDPGRGPYYESVGTQDLQQPDVSIAFLYDGPDGLSLVVVHDRPRSEAGGSVSLTVRNVPDGAEWAVKDDLYVDPETGQEENFDVWDTDGDTHTVDWTWGSAHNDGGVLRLAADDFAVAVEPAFNDAAALWGEHYAEDPITDWQFLSFPDGRENPERTSLDLDSPVTVSTTRCGEDGGIGAVLSALLDVKPGSDDARINSKSQGMIPVWVSALDDFDLDDLDFESLRFGAPRAVDAGGGAAPKHEERDGDDRNDEDDREGEKDGDDGTKVHFPTPDTGFEDGDELAKLVGKLQGDLDVSGTDSVTVFSPGNGPDGEDGGDGDDGDDEGNGRGRGRGRGRNEKDGDGEDDDDDEDREYDDDDEDRDDEDQDEDDEDREYDDDEDEDDD